MCTAWCVSVCVCVAAVVVVVVVRFQKSYGFYLKAHCGRYHNVTSQQTINLFSCPTLSDAVSPGYYLFVTSERRKGRERHTDR